MWVITNHGKFLKRWQYQSTTPTSWKICMQVKKQHLELDMEKQTDSKSGKEYVKAVNCHPVNLTYMQSSVSSVQSLNHVQLCHPMDYSMWGIPVHHQLLEPTQTHLHWAVMPSNHLILHYPLPFPPSVFPSIRVFSSSSHQVAKILVFQLQPQSFHWIFRTDFL